MRQSDRSVATPCPRLGHTAVALQCPSSCFNQLLVFGMLLINPYAGFFQSGLVVMFLLVGFSGESAVFAKAAVRAHADAKRALRYP